MSYNVLLVDDEYMIINGLQKIIPWEAEGFCIKGTARSAKEALIVMANETIDLVITDITMPEMTGLEFINVAQKEDYQFEFVILSGYQEFEFLKDGLQLGVINYLMKPVEKNELLKTVQKAKERLDSRAEQETRNELYSEILLSQWVHGEMDKEGYEELSSMVELDGKQTSWNTLIFEIPREKKKVVTNWLQENNQALFFSRNLGEKSLVITIFEGEKCTLDHLLSGSKLEYELGADWVLSLGERVTEWEDVPDSYEKASQTLQSYKFYDQQKDTHILSSVLSNNQELSSDVVNFNKTLMIGDVPTIEDTIDFIFEKIRKMGVMPIDVRHITFMLFMDIYRRFNHLDEGEFQCIINQINHSLNMDDLRGILLESIRKINQERVSYDYSENIQNVIDIIRKDFGTELTLKSVAQRLHMNVMYLGQLFKKETKKSFSQYLNQYRMKKAQNFLLYSDDNVNEIAFKLGYNNSTYFSQMFKKMNDISPTEFREKYKNSYHSVDDPNSR